MLQKRRYTFESLEQRLNLAAPVIDIPFEANEDELTTIAQIAVEDVDAGDSELLMSLSVDHGQLSLYQTDGLTFQNGDGTLDAEMTFTGTLANINAATLFIDYLGDLDFNGVDDFMIYVNDQGNTGEGGALDDLMHINVTVHPVNDVPLLDSPESVTVLEDTLTTIEGILVTDDASENDGEIAVNLLVEHGSISFTETTGITILTEDDTSITIIGTITDVNAALATTQYLGDLDYFGPDLLTINVTDQGNYGIGGDLSATKTVDINVEKANTVPTIVLPTESQEAVEDRSFFTGQIIILDDELAPTDMITVSLSSANGTVTLRSTSDFTFLDGDGIDDKSMTFTGTLFDVNDALISLIYLGDLNFYGLDTITISVVDLDLVAETTLEVNVAPVNDPPSIIILS